MICVYCIMPCSEIFLSRDSISLCSTGCTKKTLSATMFSQFRENDSSFNFLANALVMVPFLPYST